MDLNKAMIIGRLTRDPEGRVTTGGQNVSSFSVATNFSWVDSSGQRQDKPEYHNIVAWRKLAEICNQYLKKGTKVYIEGKLQTRSWQDQSGNTKYRTEIVADNLIMLDRAPNTDSSNSSDNNTNSGNPTPTYTNIPQTTTPFEQIKDSQPPQSTPKETHIKEEEIKIEDIPF